MKTQWRKNENVALDEPDETMITPLVERHPHLPDLEAFQLFSLFLTAEMISEITKETKKYARGKNNHNFTLTDNDTYHFLGLILISGYHSLPGERDYWSTVPSRSFPLFTKVMSRNRFQEIKKYFHLVDNDALGESKTAKVDSLHCTKSNCKIASNLVSFMSCFQWMKLCALTVVISP